MSEKLTLVLDAKGMGEKYLVDGKAPKAEATHKATITEQWGEGREYTVAVAGKSIKVQLNHGDPKNDSKRLAAIVEDSLAATGY